MANQLKMALIDSILSLHQRGWSQRRIARELGLDRGKVASYIRQLQHASKPAHAPLGSASLPAQPKPAHAPAGSEQDSQEPKPAHAPLGSAVEDGSVCVDSPAANAPTNTAGRTSNCTPWRAVIVVKLDLGLTAQRIYQDLVSEHGYSGSYYSVCRLVRRLRHTQPLPFRRLETPPAEEARVDFGQGAPLVGPDGRRRRPHVLRIVLSYSRKGYSEAVLRQTTEDFLRCLENAFGHFGGVPEAVEDALVLGDALLKKVVIEWAVPVESMIPHTQKDAQALGHFCGLPPEVLHQERGGLVHGVSPFSLHERKTALLQFFRRDCVRRLHLGSPRLIRKLVQDLHHTTPHRLVKPYSSGCCRRFPICSSTS